MDEKRPWASDTPVSQPEPMENSLPMLVDFGGVGMTSGGLAHSLTQADIEDVFTPFYAPEGYRPGESR